MRMRNVKNKQQIMEESSYFIKDASVYRGHFQDLFPKVQPLYLEIGMGKGKFLIENAKAHPEINFIGIEKQESIVAKTLKKLSNEKIPNLYVIACDASLVDEIFDREIERLYLNFSDPWPKVRHHSRRLTSKVFLDRYDAIFKGDASIYLRTDYEDFFSYSLVSLSQHGYQFQTVTLDLHSQGDLITTEYEDRFSAEGIPIKGFIAFKKQVKK